MHLAGNNADSSRDHEPHSQWWPQSSKIPAAFENTEFGDVLLYDNILWLSRGAILERFTTLYKHIVSFLEEIGQPFAHLEDKNFQIRLCVLTDVFSHINKLNLQLQGRQKLLCNLCEAVNGFRNKLLLFQLHAKKGIWLHFKRTGEICCGNEAYVVCANEVLREMLNTLQTAFKERFSDFAAIDDV